jgi:hypothetical protein
VINSHYRFVLFDPCCTAQHIRFTSKGIQRLAFGAKIKTMTVRTSLITAATALVVLAGTARAETIKPLNGGSVSLGNLSGVAYYTNEPKGYRVVVTLARTETTGAIRFETVLAKGQSVTLSTPQELGNEAQAVEIVRTGDTVSVSATKAAVTREAAALN